MYVYCILLSCQAVGFPKDLGAATAGAAPSPPRTVRHALTKHVRFAWPLGDILMFLPSSFRQSHRAAATAAGQCAAALAPASKQQTPIIHMRARVPVSE